MGLAGGSTIANVNRKTPTSFTCAAQATNMQTA